jgi:hypothetical protein
MIGARDAGQAHIKTPLSQAVAPAVITAASSSAGGKRDFTALPPQSEACKWLG